ncbi:hypothetical protein [Providencia rettgeri]|uniref:hypothetical protein n=1 Tax=Providencia rettgeri TaxID=587 RepID=UPI0005B48EF8|nr:hypothetical protein [Providencia rettgeri]
MKETFKPFEEGKMSFNPTVKPVPSSDIQYVNIPVDHIANSFSVLISVCEHFGLLTGAVNINVSKDVDVGLVIIATAKGKNLDEILSMNDYLFERLYERDVDLSVLVVFFEPDATTS